MRKKDNTKKSLGNYNSGHLENFKASTISIKCNEKLSYKVLDSKSDK